MRIWPDNRGLQKHQRSMGEGNCSRMSGVFVQMPFTCNVSNGALAFSCIFAIEGSFLYLPKQTRKRKDQGLQTSSTEASGNVADSCASAAAS